MGYRRRLESGQTEKQMKRAKQKPRNTYTRSYVRARDTLMRKIDQYIKKHPFTKEQ